MSGLGHMDDRTPEPGGAQGRKRVSVRRSRVKRRRRTRLNALQRIRRRFDRLGANLPRGLGIFIEALLIAMLVAAPLPLGSVAPWARSILFLCACALLLAWVLRAALTGSLEVVRTPVWPLAIAYLGILLFQLVPLPHGMLSLLSPRTAELYTRLLPGYPDAAGPMPLSLDPHATVGELYRLLTLLLVFFVFVNHYRDRGQVTRVLWALAAVGLFQSLYGLAERFSGSPHVFWIALGDRVSVHGTYFNRNHFAGLMGMITPAVFGLLMALLATRGRPWRTSRQNLLRRFEERFSKGKGYRDLLLGLLVAAMFVTGLLSLSRGGAVGLLVGLLVLLFFSRTRGEGHRGLFIVTLILLLAFGIVLYRGLGTIVDRFEQLTEEDSSWEGRGVLREAGCRMVEDFPLLGVGGGAFHSAFPMYQPARYGDKAARYVHNDWLQVMIETGLLGAALAYAALALFLASVLRAIRKRKESYGRILFAGAFAGVTAMLVHSLVDFNLYMVPANGLVFAVLLGICHTTAHMKGRTKGSSSSFRLVRLNLSSLPVRVGLPCAVLAVLALACGPPIRIGLADLDFNRYLAWARETPDPYFFWRVPVPDTEDAGMYLERAAERDPGAAEHHYQQGWFRLSTIRESIRSLAGEMAGAALRLEAEAVPSDPVRRLARDMVRQLETEEGPREPDPEEIEALRHAFIVPAKARLQAQILEELAEADAAFREAIQLAPTVPWYHSDLAAGWASFLLPGPTLDRERPRIERLFRDALALAPNRPAIQYQAAWYDTLAARQPQAGTEAERAERQGRALDMFRRAIDAEPRKYALTAYAFLLDQAGEPAQSLFRITPETIQAQRVLLRFLQRRGLWEESLRASRTCLTLMGMEPDGSGVPDIPVDSPEFRILLTVSHRHVRTLQRLGMDDAWRREMERYRTLLGRRCRRLLERSRRMVKLNRFREADKYCEDCLALDWNDLDALLTRMEVALLPGAGRKVGITSKPFLELYRGLLAAPPLAPDPCGRVAAILDRLEPVSPPELLRYRLAGAVRDRSCGRAGEAAQTLEAMLLVQERPFLYWHQRQLIPYQLGLAREAIGDDEGAVRAYRQALALAPSHLGSLERLVAMGAGGVPLNEERGRGAEGEVHVPPKEAEGDSEAGSSPAEAAPVATGAEQVGIGGAPAETVGDRLRSLSPEVPWRIDLQGRFELLGLTLDYGPGIRMPAEGTDASEGITWGFTARYFWKVGDDLDPSDFRVLYRYYDAAGNLIFQDHVAMLDEDPDAVKTPDGGIGTVLVHWHYMPFPEGLARQVRILVQQRPKGEGKERIVPAPLRPLTGERWVSLGLR